MPPLGIYNGSNNCFWITLVQCLRALKLDINLQHFFNMRDHPQQEDAHEILTTFMNLPEFPQDFFKTRMKKSLKALVCNHTSHKESNELIWSVALDNHTNLNDILKANLDPHYLEDYTCKCGTRRLTECEVVNVTYPRYLIIHLKRFEHTNGVSKKIETYIDYPNFLRINSSYYKLKAVACHQGSLNSGHYTALTEYDGDWWECNDSNVSKATDVFTHKAYMLFYQKM